MRASPSLLEPHPRPAARGNCLLRRQGHPLACPGELCIRTSAWHSSWFSGRIAKSSSKRPSKQTGLGAGARPHRTRAQRPVSDAVARKLGGRGEKSNQRRHGRTSPGLIRAATQFAGLTASSPIWPKVSARGVSESGQATIRLRRSIHGAEATVEGLQDRRLQASRRRAPPSLTHNRAALPHLPAYCLRCIAARPYQHGAEHAVIRARKLSLARPPQISRSPRTKARAGHHNGAELEANP
jgi:hypothetical protein